LGSLPGKYNALVTAWDSVGREEQTLDNLRLRLINEEARIIATDEASDALAAMSLKVNKTQQRTREKRPQHSRTDSVECYYCHKPGHYAKNCRKKKRDEDRGTRDKDRDNRTQDNRRCKSRNSESNTRAAFSAEAAGTDFRRIAAKDMWLLDSGASKHMTFRSDWISDLQKYSDEHVLLGDGKTCKVHGRGTVYIKRLVNNQWLEGSLENVFYVSD